MNILQKLSEELDIKYDNVVKTVELLDEGNTIPFIARYRKEITGNLTDETLRQLNDRLTYLRNLQERKDDITRLIDEQGKLTEDLKKQIDDATILTELEDIYLPFKPKKRTRGSIAVELGLQPVADMIMEKTHSLSEIEKKASEFVNGEEIKTVDDAISKSLDIIAEFVSEQKVFRDIVRNSFITDGVMKTEEKNEDESGTYKMYYDYSEKVKDVKAHRVLAVFRGEKEGFLKVSFILNDDYNIFKIMRKIARNNDFETYDLIEKAVKDSYKRLIVPSIETEVRQSMKEMADDESIGVFKSNLKPYLMQPPIKETAIIGLDPGFRTGCKVAVISEYGDFLDSAVIYVTDARKQIQRADETLKEFIDKYNVKLIAIGNGTASRETEKYVSDLLAQIDDEIFYAIVNEAGASIYSASKLAIEEFPDLDVTIRGAISIARRIQDPLAELVKISPQSIGVGQYQHDVNQKKLKSSLEEVVEDCVNTVGVNINTASSALLNYVSGITKTTAKNIVDYKIENGPFTNRQEILKVKGIGPKAFVQCAGFLRIPESEEILDNTEVHPESYEIAKQIMKYDLNDIDVKKLSEELEVGEPTLRDIIEELKKPGRDPRDEMPKPVLRQDVLSIDDLEEGMIVTGTVRNVVDFGAFIDIGIKEDGLCHISKMSNSYIKNPREVCEVSDTVKVKIIGIDKERGLVSLSMKL
ncbi:S1 RNA-binding domain-containing protein [Finegoldia sp. BIOML-A2]|uniref:Tex family protein n=1 Tax=unclassified Finegoldia TaxID=2619637 RepID=UPI0012B05D7B|nr:MULTISPECIES: Tex family protein [unclassified Finegoldia]MSA96734.1 S1 RNA-binding domain-containing protein [Finegoldia sp. BIOML-A5]MSB00119.1 S1 RNA-binding domain-containing protein [Finegoldia sp. BIOML-A2]MSB10389.1 S1 RNA-binding domain-containing protein [Finegoldia sp. BIOML-A1]